MFLDSFFNNQNLTGWYNSKITDSALVISNIFGSKIIPWGSIISMSTVANDSIPGAFAIMTSDKTYRVSPSAGFTFDSFPEYIAKKSKLKIVSEPENIFTHLTRWAREGSKYKHSNYFDKFADSLYGVKSKEGMLLDYLAWGTFIILATGLILVLLNHFI